MAILHVNIFWCDDAPASACRLVVNYCRQLASTNGFDLEILPHNDRDENFKLPFKGEIFSGMERATNSPSALNDLIDQRVRQFCGTVNEVSRVVVVFGRLGSMAILGGGVQLNVGHTVQADLSRGESPRLYKPYCVVDPVYASTGSPWSLLHEMGHAAGAQHSRSDPHDLMFDGNKSEVITISQTTADAFNQSFFKT